MCPARISAFATCLPSPVMVHARARGRTLDELRASGAGSWSRFAAMGWSPPKRTDLLPVVADPAYSPCRTPRVVQVGGEAPPGAVARDVERGGAGRRRATSDLPVVFVGRATDGRSGGEGPDGEAVAALIVPPPKRAGRTFRCSSSRYTGRWWR